MKTLSIFVLALCFSFSLEAQNLGVDQAAPMSKVDINGNLSVGAAYSGTMAAPVNGAIIEGNVGIGTASPASQLHIEGSGPIFTAHDTASGNSGIRINILGAANPSSKLFQVQDSASSLFTLEKSGELGIGTISPRSKLDVAGSSRFEVDTDSAQYVKIGNLFSSNDALRIASLGDIEINIDDNGNSSSKAFRVMNSESEIMRVTDTRRLGFGTSAPSTDIHLKQSTSTTSGSGGMTFEEAGAAVDDWKLYHSGIHFSFSENGARMAYVEGGTGDWTQPSDRSLKTNFEAIPDVLSRVLQLRPTRYHYLSANSHEKKTLGFIAQEVQAVFPEMVHNSEEGKLGLAYKDFGILAIKAIQEQQEIIDAQQATIENLMLRLEKLEQTISKK